MSAEEDFEGVVPLSIERRIRADAWAEGVRIALLYAVRNPDGITLRLDMPNPYGPTSREAESA